MDKVGEFTRDQLTSNPNKLSIDCVNVSAVHLDVHVRVGEWIRDVYLRGVFQC